MNAKKILEYLELSIGIKEKPRNLKISIEQALRTHAGLKEIEAVEVAEKFENIVRNLIRKQRSEHEHSGTLPKLVVNDINEHMVMGSCWKSPTDSIEVSNAKARRSCAQDMHEAIRSLTFNEFEIFGSKVLRELGASKFNVTPHSSDQGIDFYGILNLGELGKIPLPFLRLTHDIQIHFIGQAKHYPNRAIGPSIIRELVGSISLARYQLFSVENDLFQDLELRALSPLLAMVFTTGHFTKGASKLARKAGIIAHSGQQLSVFLADLGVGVQENNCELHFNLDLFREWLSS